jgi:hypothetical protein
MPVEPRREATMEISDRDIVRPPAYGLSESIRLPKNRTALPWIGLLLLGAGGYGVWRDPAGAMRLAERARDWGRSQLAQRSSTTADVPSTPSAVPSPPPSADAGAAHAVTEPSPSAPASAHRAAPARLGPGNVRNLRPSR